ncbi:MAG: energy transducer TonB [Pyrinomonadaceae bacterium]
MFNNLIESSSHRSEYRRRGSFFLFTTASYAVFFVIAGVASIYAYDARMGDQNLEFATIMPLVDLPVPEPPRDVNPSPATGQDNGNQQNFYVRRNPMEAVDNPLVPPAVISSTPNDSRPMPPHGVVVTGPVDADPSRPGGSGSGSNSTGNGIGPAPIIVISEPPAPVPTPKPIPNVVRKNVINGDALVLPKPAYPPMARQMGVHGTVNVQVLIDEFGKVISATPVSGHPLLVHVAKSAAYQARFSPTLLGDQPVKVSGVITYNFVLQ